MAADLPKDEKRKEDGKLTLSNYALQDSFEGRGRGCELCFGVADGGRRKRTSKSEAPRLG